MTDILIPESPELEHLDTRDFHITEEELTNWEIGEVPATEPKLQTSMRASAVPEKALFLQESLGLQIPDKWTSPPDFLPCIHVAYTLASYLSGIRDIQQVQSPEERAMLLRPINVWMNRRIETKYGWRMWLPGLGMTVEGFYRRRGAVKNTDQLVSEDEMRQVVALFRDRFRRR